MSEDVKVSYYIVRTIESYRNWNSEDHGMYGVDKNILFYADEGDIEDGKNDFDHLVYCSVSCGPAAAGIDVRIPMKCLEIVETVEKELVGDVYVTKKG